jgi:hypothetical protein
MRSSRILRLNLLSQWCPELALPAIGDEDRRALIEQVCHGAFGGKEIRDRPVQITQDLAGFWREHYPRVKQELQRRYPKHKWR